VVGSAIFAATDFCSMWTFTQRSPISEIDAAHLLYRPAAEPNHGKGRRHLEPRI